MGKPLPPLGWIRSFEAAARHLSFTAAAEELGLTQSAISQQIKALETRLGLPLFIRHARGLALTDAGRRLVPEIEAPLQALALAMDGVKTGPSEGLLTIATSVSVAHWILAPHLTEFRNQHPGLRVHLLSAIWPDDFHSTQADVEIRFGSAKQAGSDADLLLPNRLIAVKSPQLAGGIQNLPLIEAVGTSSGWRAWSKHIAPVGAPSLFTDTYGMALHLAVNGNGVALVSELLADHALRTGLVERIHSASIPSGEGYYLSVDKDKPDALALRNWLLGKLAKITERASQAQDGI
ncbi:LysR family transcriptional regulator [Marivita sp. XM-24bin2]|jgi:LysR family glycine cleavage system transcriptional activator|uniref:LysR family transcriptional regulator n=1 Tax=unclassified Marivita TaxID=2632480 RepID=UPI000D78E886|nr:LysR family transcriptional regulator [Marivita sp. XM-24bin2]MCR9111053.1 LysR family transcriptional regulator [Paracoccaceae bacterium]PWL32693.1 MAG: LysR family transcriptional regulator [Marivita sp. XM-24bin2]